MMRIVDSTDRLFLKNYLRDFLTLKRQALFEEIASLDEDPLLTTSLEDLCDQLVNEYTLSAPQIDESGIYSETRGPRVTEKAFFHNRAHEANSGNRVIVHIPFTGIPELFECHPLTATDVMPPRAFVRDSELAFEYQTRHVEGDGLKKAFDRDLNSLRSNLAQIAHDLEEFNSAIRDEASERIRARNDKFLRDHRIAESLGFPIRRATDLAGTSEPPTVEPDVAPPPSPIPTAPEAPQPSSGAPELPHADDYSWVRLGDQKTRLTPNPARAVRFIYEEYVRTGHPEVDEKRVLKECGSQQKRLYEVLRHCNAWGSVVTRGTEQGTVELNFPKPVKTRKNP